MESHQLVELKSGLLEVSLAPSVGGCIARFDCSMGGAKRPVLRGGNGVPDKVLDAACFPLVPYCNRIRNGCFTFRGREVRLKPNMAGDPSPLHGQGWHSSWDVFQSADSEAELRFRHEPGEWPWRYEARQHVALDRHGLSLALSCRNLSDDAMPCGLGFHPYFPCAEGARIDTRVGVAWTVDEHVLPVAKVPAEGRYDLRDRDACGQDLDNGFGNWSGVARILRRGDPFGIELTSPDAHFFQLYSPPSGELFVAEPVTHANAALNHPEKDWPGLGMRVLAPGEDMTLRARIALVTDHVELWWSRGL